MNNVPNLFLIGAPKCGTTTIYSWLDRHEDIFMASVKEPHYFDSPYGLPMKRSRYYSLFDNAPQHAKYIGEASVWYLYSDIAVKRILKELPDSKFIVCLRRPSEVAPSAHAQKVFTGHELVINFDDAWALRDKRKAGSFEGTLGIDGGDPGHMSYSHAYLLGTQLEKLLTTVPRDKVFILLMDDLREDQDGTLNALAGFLDIVWDNAAELVPANKASHRRFPKIHLILLRIYLLKKRFFPNLSTGLLRKINGLNMVEKKYDAPSDHTFAEMRTEFSEEIDKLEMLLGRDLSHWR